MTNKAAGNQHKITNLQNFPLSPGTTMSQFSYEESKVENAAYIKKTTAQSFTNSMFSPTSTEAATKMTVADHGSTYLNKQAAKLAVKSP